jgi:hypothetical protein
MVTSSSIAIAADGEHLTCGGFSLGETVHLGNFEFIADYFNGLSHSPRRSDTRAALIGPTHCRASAPWRKMIGDSAKEFLMAPSGEGSFNLPSQRRHDTGALLTPITTTPWKENVQAAQATTIVPPQTAAPRPETGFPFEQCHAHQGGQQAQVHAQQPTAEQEAAPWQSQLTSKQVTATVQSHMPPRREPALEVETVLMVDFTSTQAQVEEVASPASREGGGQAEAAVAKPLSASPLLTTDWVNKMHH